MSLKSTEQPRVLRTDIQALRALAVVSVVIFHLWPNRLTGGFVGVDVFFVISGFLITQHLVRDATNGTFSVVSFWARRIRRLLPASIAVLVATAAAILLLVPRDLWPTWIAEIGSSAAYFENWTLARNSVDYLAADNAASPTQHFWSLSVEEQFYFALPILIWSLLIIVRSKSPAKVSKALIVLLATIVVASLVACIYLTYSEPVSSYFFTQVRAWQFGSGALLASVWVYLPKNSKLKIASLLAGLTLIVLSAVLLDGSLAYPGLFAILPTLGAVLAIASDIEAGRIAKLLAWRPIQFIGDVSYSIYLWHWPLIILLPFVIGDLTTVSKVSIIVVTLLLAWLSQKYIEKPFISFGRRDGARNRNAIAGMAIACSVLLFGSMAISARAEEAIRSDLVSELGGIENQINCFGAASNSPDGAKCENLQLNQMLVPSAELASRDNPSLFMPDYCQGTNAADSLPMPCNLTGSSSSVKIALVGDSHSAQYMAAMMVLAIKNNWQVISYSKGGCPFSYAERVHDVVLKDACKKWVAKAMTILATGNFDIVITSQGSGREWASGKENEKLYAQAGLVKLWQKLNSLNLPVLAIRDNPIQNEDALTCIADAQDFNFDACSRPRSKALLFDAQVGAVRLVNSPMTQLIDFTDVFCGAEKCEAVIGGVIVGRDQDHLTNTFTKTLAPYIEVEIKRLLKN